VPELPEVEVVRRGLERHVAGRTIDEVTVLHPRAVRRHLAGATDFADAVAGRAGIIVDGGFARGTDVVKALAAGANLVGLGRLQCYALAAGGEGAIVRMLELIEDEVQRCLGLLGVTEFAELDRSYLHAAPPVAAPHVFSAFPLLKIDDYRY